MSDLISFCPDCGTMLHFTNRDGPARLQCRTCPYFFHLDKTVKSKAKLTKKRVDDVLGGEDQWKNLPQASVNCPKTDCNGEKAYFRQMQTRSADEPMTEFYRCVKCSHVWKEG